MSGFIFLDIEHPLVAWECYRGLLISPFPIQDTDDFHPSIMMANTIYSNNNVKLLNELLFESVRFRDYPKEVSRLKCIYFFKDKESTIKATEWKNHFCTDNLVEVGIEARNITRADANWITYADRTANGIIKNEYIPKIKHYWSGEPFPNEKPQWEYLLDGRAIIKGTEVRKSAYTQIQNKIPDALEVLEIARLGAILNSDIGHIIPYIHRISSDKFKLEYLIDFKDANNEDFIQKLRNYDGPKNHQDLMKNIHRPYFTIPDLSEYSIEFSLSMTNLYGFSSLKIHT